MTAISEKYNQFGRQLCKILKLDTEKTKTITISVLPDDVVLVVVEQYLQDTEADVLLPVLKEYRLISDTPTTKDSLSINELKQEIAEYEETLRVLYMNCRYNSEGLCTIDNTIMFECSTNCNQFKEE